MAQCSPAMKCLADVLRSSLHGSLASSTPLGLLVLGLKSLLSIWPPLSNVLSPSTRSQILAGNPSSSALLKSISSLSWPSTLGAHPNGSPDYWHFINGYIKKIIWSQCLFMKWIQRDTIFKFIRNSCRQCVKIVPILHCITRSIACPKFPGI